MRWLFLKDLQILRRSPLLVGMLVLYPILIAGLVGFAVTSGPSKPRVAESMKRGRRAHWMPR